MKRLRLCVLVAFFAVPAFADESAPSDPTAAQIVEKNVEARGGLDAWRKVETMVWLGHIQSANAPASNLPFILELKRPDKTRFEIQAQNEMFVRIYDGSRGWKLRPASGGGPEVQPYTPQELKSARDGEGIDGPLVDYEAKHVRIALDGSDEVDGRKAYRLRVTLPSGDGQHVWIDAKSYLEVRYDRESRNAFGQSGTVRVSYGDYRTVGGLQIPFLIESGVGTGKVTDKMVLDQVLLNPPLDDRIFARPWVPGRGNVVSVDVEPRRSPGRARNVFAPPLQGLSNLSPRVAAPAPEGSP